MSPAFVGGFLTTAPPLIVVLICISLMVTDVEHLFKSFFATLIAYLVKCLFKVLPSFCYYFVSFLLSYEGFKKYILDTSIYLMCVVQNFSP